jgi:hypothetical protein
MPFQKGHEYMPPKDAMPGRNRASSKATRDIALVTREKCDPGVLVDFNIAIASGKAAKLETDEDTGELYVDEDELGIKPTLAERVQAIKWLAERGWGQAPQMLHLEQNIRAHVAALGANVNLGQLGPAKLIQLRRFLEGGAVPAGLLPAPASTDDDATATADEDGAPALPPASAPDPTSGHDERGEGAPRRSEDEGTPHPPQPADPTA